MMKDVFGTEIMIGDTVATNLSGYTQELVVLKVIGFTPQKVRLARKGVEVCLKFPEQLVVKKTHRIGAKGELQ